jgi:AcrR family transcriptional regulator
VTRPEERRADSARAPLVRAAAQEFAHKPYSLVNLDDVVAAVEVSRGAMYFHFPSKQALARAVIEEADALARQAMSGVLGNRLAGLETLIDLVYSIAVLDMGENLTRAGMNLLESIGGADGLEARTLGEVIGGMTQIAARAVAEGDIDKQRDPEDVARMLVGTYIGIRHTSDLDDPARFLRDVEKAWNLLLPGFANPDRIPYLRQFVRRRTSVALGKFKNEADSP